jgi:hypothetical protein
VPALDGTQTPSSQDRPSSHAPLLLQAQADVPGEHPSSPPHALANAAASAKQGTMPIAHIV